MTIPILENIQKQRTIFMGARSANKTITESFQEARKSVQAGLGDKGPLGRWNSAKSEPIFKRMKTTIIPARKSSITPPVPTVLGRPRVYGLNAGTVSLTPRPSKKKLGEDLPIKVY